MLFCKSLSKIGRPSFIDLVVIMAIVGAIVVGALAFINPLERLRQKEDAITHTSASLLAQALSAYESGYAKLPWEATSKEDSPTFQNSRPQKDWLGELESKGYIKKELCLQTNLKEYLVVNTAPQKVCFYPESAKYRSLGKYDESGINECLPEGFTPCFICFEY